MKTTRLLLLISIALLSVLLFKTCKADYQHPKDLLINTTEAAAMQSLYLENQYSFINEQLKAQYPNAGLDFTNFTIDLQSLKNYIAYAEKIAENENYTNIGFRMNLGAIKNPETQIPYTSLYYNIVGLLNDEKAEKPIKFENLKRIPSISDGDRVGSGGNPPTLIVITP